MSEFLRVVSLIWLVIFETYASEIPVGHLQPLGSHRPPATDLVDEVSEWPTPQEFWTKYVKPSRALILRGAAKHSKAFTEWTDEYLKKNYGDLEVRLEGKKEKSGRIPVGAKGVGRDTIGNFIDNSHRPGTNTYIVSDLPTPMYKDVTVIPPLTCGSFKDHLVEVDLWMSGGGTSSIMHKDAFNAINCLINGTKYWKLVEYKYEDKIYKAWEPPEMIGGYSRVNVRQVDLLKYPKVAEVPWSNFTINAGDCLFLPKSYYHQVTSIGDNNAAVAFLFSRFEHLDDLDFSDCDRELHPTPLSEMDVDWKYPGHGNLTMGNTDIGIVKESIKLLFEDKDRLDAKALAKVSRKPLTQEEKDKKQFWHGHAREFVKLIWKKLGGRKRGYITLEQVQNLTRDEMRELVLAMEGTDITNTENHEYGYIGARQLRPVLQELLEEDGHIKKQKLVNGYMEELGGSELFAVRLFNELNSNDDDVVTPEEYGSTAEKALERYGRWEEVNDEIHKNDNAMGPNQSQDAYVEDEEEEQRREQGEEQGEREQEGELEEGEEEQEVEVEVEKPEEKGHQREEL